MTPRGYQIAVSTRVRAAWRAGARRIAIVMPTGGGKTFTAAHLAAGAVAKGRRVLWLCHRRELVDQAASSLARVGVTAGVILAGRKRDPRAAFQVGSVQTLTAAGEAPDADLIFLDECHHATAGTWRAIVDAYPRIEAVFGLTATPQRGDGTPLGDVFDHLEVACSVADLQQSGDLVPCEVRAPSRLLKDLSSSPVDAYRSKLAGKRALVFAASVEHAHALAAEFNAAGIPAAAVEGGTSAAERADALAALAEGRILVVINVFCLTEGTDIPPIEGIIIARGCAAWATWIQMIGRGLRPSPATGKTKCIVLDLRGFVHVHGLPDDEREFSLTGKASVSKAPNALTLCRSCGATFRLGPPACPRCGAVAPKLPPPRVKREALGEVGRDFKVASHDEKRSAFESLSRAARERGYKPAWIGIQFKQRFGHWPQWRVACP